MIYLPIILASGSLYRSALLGRLGVAFSTQSPDVDETARQGETPKQLCARLSKAKADAVAAARSAGLVIGSDQVVVDGDTVLGKPGDHAHALQQLRALRGRTCAFLTGLHVLNIASGRRYASIDRTEVRFRELPDPELERYLRFDEPYDCAGSFKAEAAGAGLLEWQRGDDPSALIGLPLMRLAAILRMEGAQLFASGGLDPARFNARPDG